MIATIAADRTALLSTLRSLGAATWSMKRTLGGLLLCTPSGANPRGNELRPHLWVHERQLLFREGEEVRQRLLVAQPRVGVAEIVEEGVLARLEATGASLRVVLQEL